MPTLFVAGSIAISRLHPDVIGRIGKAVDGGMDIVVGDADGADRSIQQALVDLKADHVTVFCSGHVPRNNLGGWPVHTVHPVATPGTRGWFTAKDIEMAQAADYGLMVWDSRSTGTLSNVMELLARQRTSVVFVNKDKAFVTITDIAALDRLVAIMSPSALDTAERKIGLTRRLAGLRNEQFDMAV